MAAEKTPEELLDNLLAPYRERLGRRCAAYHNHCRRVLRICRMQDPDPENGMKYAVAVAFHDLGIWTAGTFDYLAPSKDLAESYLRDSGRESWIEEIGLMIEYHHKRSPYKGPHAHTVEVFRKADWVDLFLGWKRFGMERKVLRRIRKESPNRGFHFFLLRRGVRWFLGHPFNPLPMFRK